MSVVSAHSQEWKGRVRGPAGMGPGMVVLASESGPGREATGLSAQEAVRLLHHTPDGGREVPSRVMDLRPVTFGT